MFIKTTFGRRNNWVIL